MARMSGTSPARPRRRRAAGSRARPGAEEELALLQVLEGELVDVGVRRPLAGNRGRIAGLVVESAARRRRRRARCPPASKPRPTSTAVASPSLETSVSSSAYVTTLARLLHHAARPPAEPRGPVPARLDVAVIHAHDDHLGDLTPDRRGSCGKPSAQDVARSSRLGLLRDLDLAPYASIVPTVKKASRITTIHAATTRHG